MLPISRRNLLGQICSLGPAAFGMGATDDRGARIDVVAAEGMAEWDRINLERNLRWILSRERVTRHGRAKVGVFADAGVWHVGAWSIVEALEKESTPCRVLDRSMLREAELNRFDAIVLPGGWAPFQRAAVAEPGIAALKAYVEGGGRCLGICVAHTCCRAPRNTTISAIPTRSDYSTARRGGRSRGWPVSRIRVRHASRSREGRRRGLTTLADEPLYYSGGPCFLAGHKIEILARFHEGSPAAISRKVGMGEVVLIGAHPERPAPGRGGGGDDAPPPAHAGETLRRLLSLGK